MRRVIRNYAPQLEVAAVYRKGGADYLRQRLNAFNRASHITPYVMLTDLDTRSCPPALIADWFQCPINQYRNRKHTKFVFCVAVREVETWLLADRDSCAQFLGVSRSLVPPYPERIPDPKQQILKLAARSRYRNLREGIAPRPGSVLQVGPEYNERLGSFVHQAWRSSVAAEHSPSLRRTLERLKNLVPRAT